MTSRADGLGQDFTGIISATIMTAGAVTSSFIGADAIKYAARQQSKSDLLIALAKEKATLEAIKAQEGSASVSAQAGTQSTVAVTGAINTIVAAGTVLALVGIAAYVAMKE
jgi:hypothetical protein